MEIIIFGVLLVILIGFWGFVLLLLIFMGSSLFVWPPSMPTDSKTRNAMVALAKKHFAASTAFKMTDLGSGYGHLIKIFAKNFPNAGITGFEILRPPYYFSKKLFSRNANISIIKQDFLNADFSQFDLLITFYKEMVNDTRLVDKLFAECKKGAIIISNNFMMPGMQLVESVDIKLMVGTRKVYLYVI